MTYSDQHHILAIAILICCVITFFIDVGTEFNIRWALRLKWSLAWVGFRYAGAACAVLLAVNVLA